MKFAEGFVKFFGQQIAGRFGAKASVSPPRQRPFALRNEKSERGKKKKTRNIFLIPQSCFSCSPAGAV
jgi:hypothetical protein